VTGRRAILAAGVAALTVAACGCAAGRATLEPSVLQPPVVMVREGAPVDVSPPTRLDVLLQPGPMLVYGRELGPLERCDWMGGAFVAVPGGAGVCRGVDY
jgi:hypothetical protein